MRVGIDIVQISRFEKAFNTSRGYFEDKIFSPEELLDVRPTRLAGIFAAKEAVMKALSVKAGHWKEIVVSRHEDGRPRISKLPQELERWQSDLSISHDGDYAIAFVLFYKGN